MRLIDADKIVYSWQIDADGEEHDGVTLESIVKKMPTIEPRCETCEAFSQTRLLIPQPERKTGRWIGYLEPGNETYHCSACGTAWYPEDLYLGGNDYPKYCPECGALMENWQSCPEEGEQDGEST